jgi:SAM-dependent methyltransferase
LTQIKGDEHDLPESVAEHMARLGYEGGLDFRLASLRKLVLRWIQPGSALDFGCGAGHVAVAAALAGHRVVATDLDEQMRAIAAAVAERAGADVAVRPPDQIGAEQFDNVICLDVIEHVEDEGPLLVQLRQQLVPSGRLVLTVPAHPSLFSKHDSFQGHYRRYARPMLRERLEAAGFVVDRLRHWAMLGAVARWFWLRVLRRDLELAGLRYGHRRRSVAQRAANWALRTWLTGVENRVPFGVGLTLLAIARPAGD